MKYFFFIPLLLAALPTFAADSAQDQLRKQYVNSTQTLKKFYSAEYLKYDADGNLVGNSDTGPWTVYGELLIDEVNLKSNKLEMMAHRAVIVYDPERHRLTARPWKSRVIMEIATPPAPDQLSALQVALQRIFVNSHEDMLSALPDYWKFYYATMTSSDPAAKQPTQPKTNAQPNNPAQNPAGNQTGPSSSADVPRKLRVSSGVAEGLIIKKVEPSYLPIAKAARAEGDCILQATIGKDGHLAKLMIVQPVGAGLDDEAVRAISQWQYRPYQLQGQPVEVDTTITVRFHLGK